MALDIYGDGKRGNVARHHFRLNGQSRNPSAETRRTDAQGINLFEKLHLQPGQTVV
jgi:hypothetical protein